MHKISTLLKKTLTFFHRNQLNSDNIKRAQLHHEEVLRKIREKRARGGKIIVGFFVIHDSAFPALPLLRNIQHDQQFEARLILIPEVLRGKENMLQQLDKSYRTFSLLTENLVVGYEAEKEIYIDVSEDLDFVCISNPYDCLTHTYFTLNYLSEKNVLPFFIDYSFTVSIYSRKVIAQPEFTFFWKIFTPNNDIKKEHKNFSKCASKNVLITGYCKMDDLAHQKFTPRNRKKIILAPHHTIIEWKDGLEIGSFLRYSTFLLKLPSIYQNIDFVFRPHPLLFLALSREDIWGKQKTDEYFNQMISNPNVRFSDEQNYLELFANSDGLIHDCGSFVAEYIFTNNPPCFICTDKKAIFQQFTPIGQKCLSHHYLANTENEILNFINNVILNGEDPMCKKRVAFAEKKLKINYPNSTGKIIKVIRRAID